MPLPKQGIFRDREFVIGALFFAALFAFGFWWGGWFWHY
jgi:hypothetical protein